MEIAGSQRSLADCRPVPDYASKPLPYTALAVMMTPVPPGEPARIIDGTGKTS